MLTKKQFFEWLKGTKPPRKIVLDPPVFVKYPKPFIVLCVFPDIEFSEIILHEFRSELAAEKAAAKFRRWLNEFEEKEKTR